MKEQMFFIIISVALVGIFFYKMIKENETIYIYILILEALGIIIDAIELIFSFKLGIFLKTCAYINSIVIPITIILLQYRKIDITDKCKIKIAKINLSLGNTKKTKNILLSMAERKQDNYEVHKMLAEIYEKEGGIRKSIDEYVMCIEINKKDYQSYYHIATLLKDLDKQSESIQMLYELLEKKPDYYEAGMELSQLLIDKAQYKDAVAVLTESLKYNPTSFEINYELGIAYTMLNDFKSAKEYYEKASEINTFQYNTKYYLGQIALLYKDINLAETYFEQTTSSDEFSADSYYELAKIKLIKGEYEIAIKYINISMELDGKRISEKIKKEPLFMSIYTKIAIPFNFEETKQSNLTGSEITAKEHLENTTDITTNMGYVNIRYIKEEQTNTNERTE